MGSQGFEKQVVALLMVKELNWRQLQRFEMSVMALLLGLVVEELNWRQLKRFSCECPALNFQLRGLLYLGRGFAQPDMYDTHGCAGHEE